MRRGPFYFLLALFASITICTNAQDFHLAVGGGFASYLGDLQNKQFLINPKDPGFGISLKYQLTPNLGIRAGFNSGKVSAYDKNNTPNLRFRNLSFETWINEANLVLEYSLLSLSKRTLTPHIMSGIALFHFNPYAFDPSGKKVFLRPLSTEGQGFPEYPQNRPYSLIQFAIPIGAGIRFRLTEFTDVCMEVGYRRLFTDYLDDVSGDYIDAKILEQRKGPLAVKMAFRGDELPNTSSTYPGINYPRGKAKYNDWYTFYTTSINFRLGDIYRQIRDTRESRCPRF